MQQVLLNLVLNGMEAMAGSSAAKRRLTVQTAGDPNEEAEVVVRDTGPGISPDRLPWLFDAIANPCHLLTNFELEIIL